MRILTRFSRPLFLLVIAVSCGAGSQCNAADRQPNVILMVTDDQGYGDLSCHGNPTLQTPHLDSLYSDSYRFTDFHVAPFCTPTRAAVMTGRYPARTGAYRTSSGRTSLHPREKTLGDLFTSNGYATGIFGKWHLGDNAPSRPMDCGFERSVWHRCGGVTQISDHWTNDYFDDTYLVGDRPTEFSGYCTDVWFDEAMKFMTSVTRDAGGNKPFFVYLPTNAPHGPFLVGQKWKQPFIDAGIPAKQAAFKGMVANFDWNVGRLMSYLETTGLDSETLVIFMTDNGTAGCLFDQDGRISGWPVDPSENANMRGGKSSPYDGGHRVPLFIKDPDKKFGRPRDIDTLTMHFDLTPTLMEMCRLERPSSWPTLDGRSLVSLLNPNGEAWKPRVLHTQMHGGNGFVKPGDPWLVGAALTKRWRLVEGRELYDIQADPSQRQDRANEFPEVVRELSEDHAAWLTSVRPGMDPTRILIGSDVEKQSDLTSQDWVMPVGGPPWSHNHVVRRMISNGSWWLEVAKAGKYRFTLSRWPLSIKKPIESTEAQITIGSHSETLKIAKPNRETSATFELDLIAGPTELRTWLTTPEGKQHGAYFVSVERIGNNQNDTPSILWSQYGLNNQTLKLAVHTDADPMSASKESLVQLWLKRGDAWEHRLDSVVDPLTAMATFRLEDWDHELEVSYRVTLGESNFEGRIRAEPKDSQPLKLMAVACVNDKWFPYAEAVKQMIRQDPDLVFFAGDQIYESNAGGEVVPADNAADVPEAMANYLAKWRMFGLTFRDLLKDRPSLLITDDHDVYANDLWGNGGRRMIGDRTTGGYNMHPDWVNAVERTQMWHLPDAAKAGPWGDGINAYFTSLDYGCASFAILEDRKFKSPPSAVLEVSVNDPESVRPNDTLEVIKDPAFDARKLDRDDLHLLGADQEAFVQAWALDVSQRQRLAAVLTQSPFVNIGNYDVRFGDMDSNGWPQGARNRALRAIAPANAIMVSGDIHFGTLHRHGIDRWGDGPWSYSLPAFASKQNRSWGPSVPAQGNEIAGVPGTGNHHDRFGNKLTVAATAPGVNGYGMITFDDQQRTIRCEVFSMDTERVPDGKSVQGWPHTVDVPRN
ncbi:MAG: sulfatase-like hydrolase/transferase [Rubripirellula sp.]